MRIPFLAPECLQLSSMDCGVAAVHTLLRGHGLDVDYQTLRERCQTGVDGTSIDSLEDLCNELGVEVEQHVLPVDLAVSAMAGRYPLIAIVRRGRGVPHFVTVWSRLGRYLQVMDPAGGRVWVHEAEFERELYPHPFCLPHAQWADWMSCNSYREALTARANELLSEQLCLQEVNEILEHAEPGALRNLDAALRLVQRTSRATGQNRRAWNDRLFTRARSHFAERPAAANAFASISLEPDALCTHGTVLLMRAQAGGHPQVNGRAKQTVSSPESRPEDSARQIPTHRPSNPGWLRSLLRLLGPQARVLALGLFGAVLMLALASALELLLYRAAVDAPNLFTTFDTRFAAALSLG
ncbi:MAG TPA: cysteine peptidase family C39 domain-containing protein, partial [Polyangiaceae bacterium]|nr:cysteine peptidase family C39 domain-containing protein [Polyangiaceae bacterium]